MAGWVGVAGLLCLPEASMVKEYYLVTKTHSARRFFPYTPCAFAIESCKSSKGRGRRLLPSKTILSVGHDVPLLATRKLLFQQAGFRVISTARCSTAIDILRKRQIDVIVLCHSLTTLESEELVGAAKRVAPKIPVMLLQEPSGPPLSSLRTSKDPLELMAAIQIAMSPVTPIPTKEPKKL